MVDYLNRVKVGTSTTGTGTISLGAAVRSTTEGDFLTFAEAGAVSGRSYPYFIQEGNKWACGEGVYTSGSPATLTRDASEISWDGTTLATAPLTLTGAARVYVSPRAIDLKPALTLVRSIDVAGLSTITISNIFTTDYDEYIVDIVGLRWGANVTALNLQFRDTTNSIVSGSSYNYTRHGSAAGGAVADDSAAAASLISLMGTQPLASGNPFNASYRIINPREAVHTAVLGQSTWMKSASILVGCSLEGNHQSSTAMSGFSIGATGGAGNIVAGKIKVFGVNP